MTLTGWLSKYRTIFVLCLTERFTYRTDFFLGTLLRFLPIVTTVYLWQAIFAGSRYDTIAGLTADQMIAYYLLVLVARAFSSMPGLASGIALDIRQGAIKKYLLQPVDLIGFLMTSRLAHKLVYYAIAAAPYALVFYLCRHFFGDWPSIGVLCGFTVSLALAFLIGFLLEALIGMVAFWLLEIGSLSNALMALTYVLSGHMFPLDLMPEPASTIVKWLPFQYLAYFPAMLFLRGESMSGAQWMVALGNQLGVTVLLWILVRWTYQRGVRHYGAYGG